MNESISIKLHKPHSTPYVDGNEPQLKQWYWVKRNKKQYYLKEHIPSYCIRNFQEEGESVSYEHLGFISHIGSNFVRINLYLKNAETNSYGKPKIDDHDGWIDMSFEDFYKICTPEPDAQEFLQQKIIEIQGETRKLLEDFSQKSETLSLSTPHKLTEHKPSGSDLPVLARKSDPDEYKNKLIKARDEEFPAMTLKLAQLNAELAGATHMLCAPMYVDRDKMKKSISKIDDKITAVELYTGLEEYVMQIAEGENAPVNEPIAVRQQILFMDEETLFDYDKGGMDFEKLQDFDEWVVKPENLARILPEKKGVVAFRIRRKNKDYGPSASLMSAWINMTKNCENMQTYLLLRNGDNVYRISSQINFEPRLIPFKNEFDDFFTEKHKYWMGMDKGTRYREEHIGPDHLRYDSKVSNLDNHMKKYNRIFLVLQGLLDRSEVFSPHPQINLGNNEHVSKYIRQVRDEELAIDSGYQDIKEYLLELNSNLKKGKIVCGPSRYYEEQTRREMDRYDYSDIGKRSWLEEPPPEFCVVRSVKRDKSAVRISWLSPHQVRTRSIYGYWGYHENTRYSHIWVPMDEVVNVTDYQAGDYKQFFCNRAAKGEYLDWAPLLLPAEDWKHGKYELEEDQKE